MPSARTADEVTHLLTDYHQSNETRASFCRRHNIPVTTLDYYLRRAARNARPRLARVTLAPEPPPPTTFTLILRNGRRIETPATFRDADLARLIRIVETA